MRIPYEPAILPATPADHPELVALWEASVRATHHFLHEEDIARYRPQVCAGLQALDIHLTRDEDGTVTAFAALGGTKLEMLFVRPDRRGRGLGGQIVRHCVAARGVRHVDVNEQNTQAVGFYQRMGFVRVGRDERDSAGRPYPILHMAYTGALAEQEY